MCVFKHICLKKRIESDRIYLGKDKTEERYI